MKAVAALILFLACAVHGFAQPYTSAGGLFSVNQIRACAPFTISVDAPTCDGTVGCDINYDDPADGVDYESFLFSDTHTYTLAGSYMIQFIRGSQRDSLQIEIVENTPPEVQVVLCGGNRVSVSATDNRYDQYVINYNDGSPEVVIAGGAVNQHTYPTPGNKTISVRGRNIGSFDNCVVVNENIAVMPAIPAPTISLVHVLNSTDIRIAFNGLPNVYYRLERSTNANNSFQPVRTLFNVTADTIRNLATDDNVYCFRIAAFDPCTNTTAYSNIVCSTDLDLDIRNNENVVTWRTVAGSSAVSSRQLEATPQGSGTSETYSNPPMPFSHVTVICGREYCYQLTTTHQDLSQSISAIKCGVAISTDVPNVIVNTSAVVHEAGVSLTSYPDPDFTPEEFSLYRSEGGAFPLLTRTASTPIDDRGWSAESAYCYKIAYKDVCGNESPLSDAICPIVLTGSLTDANEAILAWTHYTGWASGVERYLLEKMDATGGLLATIDAGTSLTYTDAVEDLENQVYQYRVRAIPADPFTPSISNTVTIIKNPNLFYPAAFTPNGDQLNDVFNVFGQYISEFEMDIFNRWGELMFTTSDIEQGWDGTFKGSAMPEGTYTFVANITDKAGRRFRRSGSILLLKKSK